MKTREIKDLENSFGYEWCGKSELADMPAPLDNPFANSVTNQTRSVLQANPNISVLFAPYDEFAKGVKIALDELGQRMPLFQHADNARTDATPTPLINTVPAKMETQP